MKKRLAIQITVTKPCEQTKAWDGMQQASDGKFCNHCSQTVVDFTKMSDAALFAFLKEKPLTCGRFREDQLGRDIMLPEVGKSRVGLQWLLSFSILFFGWMKEGLAQKINGKPKSRKAPVTLSPIYLYPDIKPANQDIPQPVLVVEPARDAPNDTWRGRDGSGLVIGGGASAKTVWVIDGVRLDPKEVKFPSGDSLYKLEPPGRRTVKGDDLPHSFRLEDNSGH